MSTKLDQADITARVLRDAAQDRRQAHDRVEEISHDLEALQEATNQEYQPLAEAVQDAQAEIRAHARYKDHLPRKDWDAEQRKLQKTLDAATDKRDACREEAQRKAAPLQKRLQEAAKAAQELDVEWRIHERTAKAAAIDIDALLEEE